MAQDQVCQRKRLVGLSARAAQDYDRRRAKHEKKTGRGEQVLELLFWSTESVHWIVGQERRSSVGAGVPERNVSTQVAGVTSFCGHSGG